MVSEMLEIIKEYSDSRVRVNNVEPISMSVFSLNRSILQNMDLKIIRIKLHLN